MKNDAADGLQRAAGDRERIEAGDDPQDARPPDEIAGEIQRQEGDEPSSTAALVVHAGIGTTSEVTRNGSE